MKYFVEKVTSNTLDMGYAFKGTFICINRMKNTL